MEGVLQPVIPGASMKREKISGRTKISKLLLCGWCHFFFFLFFFLRDGFWHYPWMRPEPTYNREIGLEGSTHAVISRDVSCMIHFVIASRNLFFELCVGIDEKKNFRFVHSLCNNTHFASHEYFCKSSYLSAISM